MSLAIGDYVRASPPRRGTSEVGRVVGSRREWLHVAFVYADGDVETYYLHPDVLEPVVWVGEAETAPADKE